MADPLPLESERREKVDELMTLSDAPLITMREADNSTGYSVDELTEIDVRVNRPFAA